MTTPHVQLFLSTVSAEFRSYRDALRDDLERPNVTVKVQERLLIVQRSSAADERASQRSFP